MPVTSTLVVGCGYLGQRVGRLLKAQGQVVYGTTRSPARANELAIQGILPVLADVTTGQIAIDSLPVDRILYCVGFDRRVGQSIRQVYVTGLQTFVSKLTGLGWNCPIVYASSTGVYGGDDGGWVDETTPVAPQTESGRACVAAEEMLQSLNLGSTILRFAGLYGPGRIMRRESLLRGEPITGNPAKFLNFIQIDDAAAVAVAALDAVQADRHDLFLVADGNPIERAQFYALVAELLGVAPPRFNPPVPGSPDAQREESNKRVSNRKLTERWGSILRYPDIQAGLKASLTDT